MEKKCKNDGIKDTSNRNFITKNQTDQSDEVPLALYVNRNASEKLTPGIKLLNKEIEKVTNQYNSNCWKSFKAHSDKKIRKSIFPANKNAGKVPFVSRIELERTENGVRDLHITNYDFCTQVYDNIETDSTKRINGTIAKEKSDSKSYQKVQSLIGTVTKRSKDREYAYPFFKKLCAVKLGQKALMPATYDEQSIQVNECIQRMTGGGDCNPCSVPRQHDNTCFCPCTARPCERLSKLFPIEIKDFRPTFGDGPSVYAFPKDCKRYKMNCEFPMTLGSPIGRLTSSVFINDKSPYIQNERFASYLKSMAIIYLKDVREWVSGDLDLIIKEGQDLAIKSTLSPDDEPHKDVYSEIESKVNRMYVFNGYRFKIELEPGDWNPSAKNEMYNELNSFFKRRNYCLIQFKHWYLLIWKERNKYFVLDLNGRDASTLLSSSATSTQKSVAILLCLKKLRNIVHLIVNMSNLDESESFLMRPVVFAEIVTPEGGIVSAEFGVRQPEYKMINENYSYLLSNLHLTLNPAVPVRNRSAFPVSISAIIASKIDHPATWNSKMLDKIICYGVNVCRECWEPCVNLAMPINVDTFPRCMHMGQFLVSYELTSQKYVGKWKSRPVLLHNEFRNIIKEALIKHTNILFQINNQMYAIWQKTGFYYLLDPYLHFIWGLKDDENNPKSGFKSASLRMFRSVDTLINVFHNILLQSNKTSDFYVHTLKVASLVKCQTCRKVVEMPIEDEVLSLNEYICFDEDYSKCLDELGQYSDYEEDILSLVTLVSSVETSISMVEEEEGEGADAAGLSGFESASSGRRKHGKGSGRIKSGKPKGSDILGMGFDKGGNKGGNNGGTGEGDDAALTGQGGAGNDDRGGKDGTGKDDTGKDATGKEGTGKHGTGKEGTEKDGTGKDGTKKDGTGKGSTGKDGTRESGTLKEDTGKSGAGKDGDLKNGGDANDKNITESDKNRDQINKGTDDTNLDERNRSKLGKVDKSENENGDPKLSDTDKSKLDDKAKNKLNKSGKSTTRDVSGKGRNREANEKVSPLPTDRQMDNDQDEKDKRLELLNRYGKAKFGMERYKKIDKPDLFLDSPCYSRATKNLVIARSDKGTYESICKILYTALKCCDRVLIMTPMRNFVVFRGHDYMEDIFFVHDGCTCNLSRFRHMDLSCGTAGLLPFSSLHNVICYILNPNRGAPRCSIQENLDETETCRTCFRNL